MKLKIISCFILLTASFISQAESLADIYRQALLNDPTYRLAEVEFNIGKNSTYKAWAKFLPQLNIDPTGSYTKGTDNDSQVNTGEFTRVSSGEETTVPSTKTFTDGSQFSNKSVNIGSLTFNLGINQWFTFKNDLLDDKDSQLKFSQAQQQLIIDVTESYFAILKAHADLQTAEEAENLSRLQLELAEERLTEGLNTITDTHTAKADYYSAQINTQSNIVELDQAFEALSLLTGRSHYTLAGFNSDIPAPAPTPLDSEQWVQAAIKNGYDLQLRKIERDRAQNDRKSDKFFYLPSVSSRINGGSYSSSAETINVEPLTERNDDGSVTTTNIESTSPSRRDYRKNGVEFSVELNIPLFGNNGLGLIERRERAQREQIAHENFLKSYRQTEFAIRSSFMRLLNQKRSLKLQTQRLEQAQLAYEKTKIEYEHGSKSLIDLGIQQNNLLSSQQENTQARYDYITELLKLKQGAGKLTPKDIFEIDSWLKEENQVVSTQRKTIKPANSKFIEN